MTEKQTIWNSILHWRRMIKWVEKQPPKEASDFFTMEHTLGEAWGYKYCAVCRSYHLGGPYYDCKNCPLGKKYGSCTSDVKKVKNAYARLCFAVTWRGWLYHARRLLKQLESLRVKK